MEREEVRGGVNEDGCGFPNADQLIALLEKQGIKITRNQAEKVILFLGQQSNIIVSQFLRKCK